MLEDQAAKANRLGVTIDPNAILVAQTPTHDGKIPVKKGRSSSFG